MAIIVNIDEITIFDHTIYPTLMPSLQFTPMNIPKVLLGLAKSGAVEIVGLGQNPLAAAVDHFHHALQQSFDARCMGSQITRVKLKMQDRLARQCNV